MCSFDQGLYYLASLKTLMAKDQKGGDDGLVVHLRDCQISNPEGTRGIVPYHVTLDQLFVVVGLLEDHGGLSVSSGLEERINLIPAITKR